MRLVNLFKVRIRLTHFDPIGPLQKISIDDICSDANKASQPAAVPAPSCALAPPVACPGPWAPLRCVRATVASCVLIVATHAAVRVVWVRRPRPWMG